MIFLHLFHELIYVFIIDLIYYIINIYYLFHVKKGLHISSKHHQNANK